MNLKEFKITEADKQSNGVISAPDTLTGTAQQNKTVFDRLVGFVADRYNLFVDKMESIIKGVNESLGNVYTKTETNKLLESKVNTTDVYNKNEIYTKTETKQLLNNKANSSDVYKKNEVYTKLETNQQINQRIVDIGSSDMTKSVYDTNNNGIVDNSERLGGKPAGDYAITNNTWSLTGAVRIKKGADLNKVTTIGNYYSEEWTNPPSTILNSPVSMPFALKVFSIKGTDKYNIMQELIPLDPVKEGLKLYRLLTTTDGRDWQATSWRRAASTEDLKKIQNKADNAMPKSGGIFTGNVAVPTNVDGWTYNLKNIDVRSSTGNNPNIKVKGVSFWLK